MPGPQSEDEWMGASWPEDGRDEASQAEDGEYEGLRDKGEE